MSTRYDTPHQSELFTIRCITRHTIHWIAESRLYAKVTNKYLRHIACMTHGTDYPYIPSIIEHGLIPGGNGGERNCNHFSPYTPRDHRYHHTLRHRSNTWIFYRLSQCTTTYNMGFSANGYIMSDATISGDMIECIYWYLPQRPGSLK